MTPGAVPPSQTPTSAGGSGGCGCLVPAAALAVLIGLALFGLYGLSATESAKWGLIGGVAVALGLPVLTCVGGMAVVVLALASLVVAVMISEAL